MYIQGRSLIKMCFIIMYCSFCLVDPVSLCLLVTDWVPKNRFWASGIYAENGFKESRKKPGFSSFPPNLFGIKPMVFQLRCISIPSLSSPQVIMHSGFWNFRGEIVKNWRGVFNTGVFDRDLCVRLYFNNHHQPTTTQKQSRDFLNKVTTLFSWWLKEWLPKTFVLCLSL